MSDKVPENLQQETFGHVSIGSQPTARHRCVGTGLGQLDSGPHRVPYCARKLHSSPQSVGHFVAPIYQSRPICQLNGVHVHGLFGFFGPKTCGVADGDVVGPVAWNRARRYSRAKTCGHFRDRGAVVRSARNSLRPVDFKIRRETLAALALAAVLH